MVTKKQPKICEIREICEPFNTPRKTPRENCELFKTQRKSASETHKAETTSDETGSSEVVL